MRPETSAWFLLLSFFLFFCLIIAGTSYAGWRYYSGATLPIEDLPKPGLVRVHTNAGVVYQPKGRTDLLNPRDVCGDNPRGVHDICFQLEEGYRVKTVPEAGYGPVASIVLPDYTQIDLRAHPSGADITLKKYQVTRWSNQRQEVVFRQDAGYARYDVKQGQPYTDVSYTVEISDNLHVQLAPGGSYSINVPHDDPGDPPTLTKEGAPMLVEVAARTGQAEIQGPRQRTMIRPGQLVQVDRAAVLSAPLPARWELIRDGDLADHSSEEYNRGTDTWSVATSLTLPAGEQKGVFLIASGCQPRTPDLCPRPADRTTIGQFRREGGQKAQFITRIVQSLDVDVSEYRRLKFSAWTRVLTQTVSGAGIDGTECPIMIAFTYQKTSPSDNPEDQTMCLYSGAEAPLKQGYIKYFRVPRFEWKQLEIDLRTIPELKAARYLKEIRIEARGHDYLSEVTAISLVGAE
jgi:hypothetical protein